MFISTGRCSSPVTNILRSLVKRKIPDVFGRGLLKPSPLYFIRSCNSSTYPTYRIKQVFRLCRKAPHLPSVELNEKPRSLMRSIGAIYTKSCFEIKQEQLQILRFQHFRSNLLDNSNTITVTTNIKPIHLKFHQYLVKD